MKSHAKALTVAAMNAATLASNSAGNGAIGLKVGLTSDDLQRARVTLAAMPQDCMTSVFERRDYLIKAGWRPARMQTSI